MSLLCLSMLSLSAAPLGDGPAFEIRYNGTVSAVSRDGNEQQGKQFSLHCLVIPREEGKQDCAFVVEESGAGGWAWPERFGIASLDGAGKPTGEYRAQLLYDHNETPHPIALRTPIFEFADRLADKAEWTAADKAYRVARSKKVGERDCWQVEIGSGLGSDQLIWVEKKSPLLVKVEKKLTMGRGDQFLLRMELESIKTLDAAALERTERPLQSMLQLQKDLKRPENDIKPELSKAQIKVTTDAIEKLEQEAEGTPFARLVAVISRDSKSQSRRSDDVATLAKRFVGQSAPELALKGLDNSNVDPALHKGKITLLHFWDYKGEPFPTEPYGQIGYLDFLHSRRHKLGVQIYGVAVDSRLADKDKPAVIRGIRKLQSFMNLSYPITLDDGTLLAKFGDPQRTGAKLPLWILIDQEGKISEYKVGNYDIKADEGLKQLDAAIVKLIQKKGDAEPKKP
ncbi:MAG: TlpA disulfide reductase family protein [Planctomycetaceae bacterium]